MSSGAFAVNSAEAFEFSQKMWRILGLYPPANCQFVYGIYTVWIIAMVVSLPVSLTIPLFYLNNMKDILSVFSITVSIFFANIKVLNLLWRRISILKLNYLVNELDKRVQSTEEQEYLQSIVWKSKRLCFFVLVVFVGSGISSEIAAMLSFGKRLMYEAWYPFDWRLSVWRYIAAHVHQAISLFAMILQNVAMDTFPPIHMYILTAHIRTLNIRIRKIGTIRSKSLAENYDDLIACIRDHQVLVKYFFSVQQVTSAAIFLQFFVTGLESCMTAVYLIFGGLTFFQTCFVLGYFISIILEVFLCCYYGNELIIESHMLTDAIYSCNWIDQNLRFKKVLIIFMQSTQKDMMILAGGVINVNAGSFIKVIRSSYSLFAVLVQMT